MGEAESETFTVFIVLTSRLDHDSFTGEEFTVELNLSRYVGTVYTGPGNTSLREADTPPS